MRFCILVSAFATILVMADGSHTFMGTNVMRQLVLHRLVTHSGSFFTKRIEYLNYTIPAMFGYGRTIQGILAYDLHNKGASANVTSGGIGFPYVSLRMKSDHRQGLKYDIYIYA